VIFLDAGPLAIRNAIMDLTSGGPLALTAGTFDGSLVTVGTTVGDADFNLTGPFPVNGTSSLAGQTGLNGLLTIGTVVTAGGLTTITIPISVDVPVSVSGLTFDAIFSGQIVASGPAVPEPSTFVLAGIGLVGIGLSIVKRRRAL
jgi:PEP-CTERM motif